MIIETSRLIIKPIDEIDLRNIIACISNIYLNIPIPKNASSYQIKKFIDFNDKIKSFNSLGYFSIHLKQTNQIIGMLSIIPRYINENLINEIGYLISKDFRNNGFASEVVFNMLTHIFSKTNITRIYSLVEKNNLPSKHILENKMKFDFFDIILDTNSFKDVYTLDKNKFVDIFKELKIST